MPPPLPRDRFQVGSLEAPSAFTFSAAGDHGNTSNTVASLERLAASGSDFYLALGDLSYEPPGTEAAWCDLVRSKVGEAFPFELLAGNHEDDARIDGWIGNFAECLPDRLNVTGAYGADYVFDYPSEDPFARFLLISPDLTLFDVAYRYDRGDEAYDRLASRIDEARAAGIPWVIVAMHKVCLSTGHMRCEIGMDLLNLLVEKRVDLILQGHDHTYQRSGQLALSAACPEIVADAFDSDCMADDGSDDRYAKGNGSVFIVNGAFGAGLSSINASDVEAPYFTEAIGSNTPGAGTGFTSFTVTRTAIEVRTNLSGTFQDGFSIDGLPPSSPRFPMAAAGTSSITVAWEAPAWDGGLPVTNYTIYRGTGPGGGRLVTLGPEAFEYEDASVVPGTTYYYRVSALNAAGEGEQSAEVSATVGAPGGLQVSASSSPSTGLAPLSVSFTSSVTGGLEPYEYLWTFGDGETNREANPVHSFADSGDYDVDLAVTDSRETVAHDKVPVSVYASLTAVATPLAAVGRVPLAVSFSATVAGGRPPYSFDWDFGDGNTSSLRDPSHTYRIPGDYEATITVTDAIGQMVTKTLFITASSASSDIPKQPGEVPFGIPEALITLAILVGIGGAVAAVAWMMRIRRPP